MFDRGNTRANGMAVEGGEPIQFDGGFRVGDFEVYPTRLAFVKDGTTVRVEPKVMAVLVHLAQRAGQVVTRDEFADEVWRSCASIRYRHRPSARCRTYSMSLCCACCVAWNVTAC